MRYILLIITCISICCFSCKGKQEVPEALIGEWKIYKTRLNKKDISKSADPTNVNGLEFQANGNYISFGNPRHQDEGAYEVSGAQLTFKSSQTTGITSAKMILSQDTLELNMSVDSTKTLFMKLYKMK